MKRFVSLLVLLLGAAASAGADEPGPGYDIDMSRMIPMRDGVELESWITRPSRLRDKVPAILELTQYEIDGGRRADPAYFARAGYVFVQVYTRGRGRSGGVKSDSLGAQVGRDGYDVVEWIAAQPWSNGQVVMYGSSFVGMTQWRTATQHPPHLAAIAPFVPIYPGWDVPNTNGIPQAWTTVILGLTSGRALNSGFIANQEYWAGKMLEQYAAQRPFSELDRAVGIAAAEDWWMPDGHGGQAPMMRVWLDHVGDEAFNLAAEPRAADYRAMDFPVLTATGFFDDDQPGALHYYRNHVAHAPAAAAAQHYLVIGPWDHGGTYFPAKEIQGLAIPAPAVLDMKALHRAWYAYALGRGPRPEFFRDRVAYFMMGADEWRYAPTLEGASGAQQVLYLSERAGTPGDVLHSGRLSTTAPRSEPAALMVSDPHELPELEVAQYLPDEGLTSQFRGYMKRAMVFHSEPFPADTEIAGHVRLALACAADAPDFDLWAQLMLVRPDGSAVQLGQPDVRRARFRNGFFKAELLKPGERVEIPFEFAWTAWRIPAGARLRLVLMPLNSPNYQKNYNTGGRIGYERPEDARVAHISIFHDSRRTSRLVLPLAAPSSVH